QHLGHDPGDLLGWKVDHGRDLPPDQLLGLVQLGHLSRGLLAADLGAEVDLEHVRRLARRRIRRGADHGAGAHVDFGEVVVADGHFSPASLVRFWVSALRISSKLSIARWLISSSASRFDRPASSASSRMLRRAASNEALANSRRFCAWACGSPSCISSRDASANSCIAFCMLSISRWTTAWAPSNST